MTMPYPAVPPSLWREPLRREPSHDAFTTGLELQKSLRRAVSRFVKFIHMYCIGSTFLTFPAFFTDNFTPFCWQILGSDFRIRRVLEFRRRQFVLSNLYRNLLLTRPASTRVRTWASARRRVVVACLCLNGPLPRRDLTVTARTYETCFSTTTIFLCRWSLSAIHAIVFPISPAVTSRYALHHESKKQRCPWPSVGVLRVSACKSANKGLSAARRAEHVAARIQDHAHDGHAQGDDASSGSNAGSSRRSGGRAEKRDPATTG